MTRTLTEVKIKYKRNLSEFPGIKFPCVIYVLNLFISCICFGKINPVILFNSQILFIYLSPENMFLDFRERGREGEREGEKD